MNSYDVIVIGGGLAGLTAALHLKKQDVAVLLIEKNSYPNHKVCGEYVSNEVKPYLKSLGLDVDALGALSIDRLQLSTHTGKLLETKLPLGGFGISRYCLDYALYNTAKEAGVAFLFEQVTAVTMQNNTFEVHTEASQNIQAKVVLGAFGKRSNLDKKLNRKFIQQKSPWLGVKCHYNHSDFPKDLVALHNFEGGYGGLSKTETGSVNFCYLANFKSFKQYNSIEKFNTHVVSKNPFLKEFLANASQEFKKPLSIAQISFEKKAAVENHIVFCGDSAGLIHPLCGNGMAMAIHSAKIASECILDYLNAKYTNRTEFENSYTLQWEKEFNGRLRMGRTIQRMLMNTSISELAIGSIARSEKIVQMMIKSTHGNPILV